MFCVLHFNAQQPYMPCLRLENLRKHKDASMYIKKIIKYLLVHSLAKLGRKKIFFWQTNT